MHFRDWPLDMVKVLLSFLKPTDLLNLGLVCEALAHLVARKFPIVRALKIGVSDDVKGSCEGDEVEIHLSSVNGEELERTCGILIPTLAAAVESLHLENEMIGEEISDEQLSRILNFVKDAPLKELAVTEIDLEQIRTWTLALFARFDRLEKLEIEGCRLGRDTEMTLLRCLQSSFETLTQIDLKGTPEITDAFSRRVSRNCPNLSYFRISDCPRVTTLSALPFIESTFLRNSDKLDVHMDNTHFDPDQLRSFMHSPLFASCSADWRLQQVVVPLGYNKPAVLALHSSRKCVLIFV